MVAPVRSTVLPSRTRGRIALAAVASALSWMPEIAASGQSAPAPSGGAEAGEIVITGRRPMTAASASTVRDRDFQLRPHARPADILAVTPGMYVVQHAGGGKANQYFLRGFDADHGTDVALFVDGVPVNLVSHGHGQGYADLHFLIPETFANASRLPGETSAASCPEGTRAVAEGGVFVGCEDLHFTPGAPFNAQASLTMFF